MVRVKERYLLVDILYPEGSKEKPDAPDFISFNQPTTDSLTPVALLRGIKSEISKLFGDYGSGSVERSLSGKHLAWMVNQITDQHQLNIFPTQHLHLLFALYEITIVSYGQP